MRGKKGVMINGNGPAKDAMTGQDRGRPWTGHIKGGRGRSGNTVLTGRQARHGVTGTDAAARQVCRCEVDWLTEGRSGEDGRLPSLVWRLRGCMSVDGRFLEEGGPG